MAKDCIIDERYYRDCVINKNIMFIFWE